MTVRELKERVDQAFAYRPDSVVCIPNHKGGMGGTPATNVKSAYPGIDWDNSKFFIQPETAMTEIVFKNETK